MILGVLLVVFMCILILPKGNVYLYADIMADGMSEKECGLELEKVECYCPFSYADTIKEKGCYAKVHYNVLAVMDFFVGRWNYLGMRYVRHGEWLFYNPEGKLIMTKHYNKGEEKRIYTKNGSGSSHF